MRKRKLSEKILDAITDKSLRFIISLFLISAYFLLTAFYSYGKVDLSELECVEGIISNIEVDDINKTDYVTFRISDNERFYITVTGLKNVSEKDLANTLENAVISNKKVTVFYTNRRILLPRFYNFSNYHRVVAIETETATIISVDDYNNANQGRFIGGIICAIILLIFAIWLAKL